MDEDIQHEAEAVAHHLDCQISELKNEPVRLILSKLLEKYNKEETLRLVKRFAEVGIMPEPYIDEAHGLLFPLDIGNSIWTVSELASNHRIFWNNGVFGLNEYLRAEKMSVVTQILRLQVSDNYIPYTVPLSCCCLYPG